MKLCSQKALKIILLVYNWILVSMMKFFKLTITLILLLFYRSQEKDLKQKTNFNLAHPISYSFAKNIYFNNNFQSWIWAFHLRSLLWVMLQHSRCPYYKIWSYFAHLEVHTYVSITSSQETDMILWLRKLKHQLMTCLELAVGKWFLNLECSLPNLMVSQQIY